jgi:hypothetical protein
LFGIFPLAFGITDRIVKSLPAEGFLDVGVQGIQP